MAKLVAKTYGDALFAVACEKKKSVEMMDEVTTVRDIIAANPGFMTLMCNPQISVDEKRDIVKQVFQGRVSEEFYSFLLILVDKVRFADVEDILEYFIMKVRDEQGIGTAYVTTADELTQDEKQRITDRLLATTSYKKIDVIYKVDASLIGGITIRIKDRVIDNSIKSKLSSMKKSLNKIQLAEE
ncbi:MAG: F0F1 ATP synthase subunit delta [Lachnospiraceae bacterium]|nr:F0F1 ATP synthase subunit delta [Lachnospiraceae bacterium]